MAPKIVQRTHLEGFNKKTPSLVCSAWAILMSKYLYLDEVSLEVSLKDLDEDVGFHFEKSLVTILSSAITNNWGNVANGELFQLNKRVVVKLAGSTEEKRVGDQKHRVKYEPVIWAEGEQVQLGLQCSEQNDHGNGAERVLGQLKHILEQANAMQHNPSTLLSNISLFNPDEFEKLWKRNSKVPPAVEACVHEMIKHATNRQPEKQAIHSWDGQLTFRQLDELSTCLAHHLVDLDVSPGRIVPLCFEKSMWAVVSAMGVLKAGGAIALMDISQPNAWLRSIADGVEAHIVLCSENSYSHHGTFGKRVITVNDALINSLMKQGDQTVSLVERFQPDNAAYAIHTSGSTGQPKAVIVQRRAFCSSAMSHAKALHIKHDSRVLQFASHSFDVSLMEIFTTLIVGGTLCIPSEHDRLNNTAGIIADWRVNWMFASPTFARTLKNATCLKTLVLGGEALSEKDVQYWADRVHLVNAYGPSECSVVSTAHTQVQRTTVAVDIGPAVGSVCWVVDPDNTERLAPLGTVGELLIEGPILAQHYLRDEQKTLDAFIDSPSWLSSYRASRLYRTGDLVRYNEVNGHILFVGRKDTQSKIRGQRVELGEIEHCLRQCLPGIHLAAEVVQLKDSGGASNLTVFLCLDGGEQGSVASTSSDGSLVVKDQSFLTEMTDGLGLKLEELLPSFMIPSVYIQLAGIPITPSGKCDRKRLRQIASELSRATIAGFRNGTALATTTPANSLEMILQALWSDLLGVRAEDIGLESNFFRLGGDSLTGIRLVSTTKERGVILTFENIFQLPQLYEMAKVAKMLDSIESWDPAPFSLVNDGHLREVLLGEACSLAQVCRSDIIDILPCTPLQDGLMALSLKDQGAYLAEFIFTLAEDIDVERFQLAWDSVFEACPLLRTRIIPGVSRSMQVVVQERIDWIIGDDLERYLTRDRRLPVEYGQRLSRYAIIGRDFVWTAHHAIFDGWSIALLLAVAERAYRGLPPQALPSFSGFVQHVENMDRASLESFWSSYMDAAPQPVFPAMPSATYLPQPRATMRQDVRLGDCTKAEVTVASMVRAAFALLVARYSDCDATDVVFGATVSGRGTPVPDVEAIAGPTFATVPVRVQMDPAWTVTSFLQRVQKQSAEMLAHEQIGLQNLQRINEDTRRACEFQSLLVINPAASAATSAIVPPPSSASTDAISKAFDFRTAQSSIPLSYALTLECDVGASLHHGTDLAFRATFDEALIDKAQMRRFLQQLEHLLHQLCHTKMLADLELASTTDVAEVLERNRCVPEAVDSCLHHLIDARAASHPHAVAVSGWDGSLTYAELAAASSKLAWHLACLGLGRGSTVPFCLEKSIWTVVTLLAILKTGGTCVPLDPTHPVARRHAILRKVQASHVITSSDYIESFQGTSTTIVSFNHLALQFLPFPNPGDLDMVDPSSLALIMFTSGSSSEPKGILLEHRSVSSSARTLAESLNIIPSSRVFQYASYTFDHIVSEIFAPLIVGACVCVPSETNRLNSLALTMNELRVTWAILTASVIKLIHPDELPSLDTLVLGGEPIPQFVIDLWAPQKDLYNAYGPTECCLCAAVVLKPGARSGLLGTPRGAVCWIVDALDHNKLAPIGAIGELLVEGPLVARGYLYDQVRTDASFVDAPAWLPNAVERPPSFKFYKTGDLVQYTPDGMLKLIGRLDAQVKMRGQRVELGEIEYRIRRRLPHLRGLAVEIIQPEKGAGNPLLAAFVCVDAQPPPHCFPAPIATSLAARESLLSLMEDVELSLRQALPPYMIPSVWIPLWNMPLTISGKCNRRQLRQLAQKLTMQELSSFTCVLAEPRLPKTLIEKTLQGLWSSLLRLKRDNIHLDHSFFQLGGDSIISMRLVAAARTKGLGLTVGSIFQNPRLSEMAKIATMITEKHPQSVMPYSLIASSDVHSIKAQACRLCEIKVSEVEDIYPCTPLQEGLIALSLKRDGDYTFQSVFSLPGSIDVDRFKSSWEAVVAKLPVLRSRIIQNSMLEPFQVVCSATESITWNIEGTLCDYLHHDNLKPIGYGEPLARYAILDGHFVLTVHHAVYDGWTWPLIFNAVERVYFGYSMPDFTGYNHFIKYLSELDSERAAGFWVKQLEGAPASEFPCLPSKAHQPNPRVKMEYKTEFISCMHSDYTLATVIQASWALLLAKYSSSSDVVLGMTVSGRGSPVKGIEHVMGPTIATIPLRICFDPNMLVKDFLVQVQRQLIDTIPYEQFGLQNIKRLSPEARVACDFQNLLVIQSPVVLDSMGLFCQANDAAILAVAGSAQGPTYAMVLECDLIDDRIMFRSTFDEQLINQLQMQRIFQQLELILHQITARPDESVSRINYITNADLMEIQGWNSVPVKPLETCIHDLISLVATRSPEDQAINSWDGQLTYAQLDELSSRLAVYLVSMGIGPEVLVPICFEKSMWTIIAMLGVLKAGGAFILLDPAHALSRFGHIIAEVKAHLIIVSPDVATELGDMDPEMTLLVLDHHAMTRLDECNHPATESKTATPTNMAYIIWTSGSSGKPKATMIEHRSFCLSAVSQIDAFQMKPGVRIFQATSYSFDTCLTEILVTLIAGGVVCIPSSSSRLNGPTSSIAKLGAEWIFSSPSFARTLQPELVRGIKRLILGGEAVRQSDVLTWADSIDLAQSYGPSECSVISVVNPKLDITAKAPNIGKGVGCRTWITEINDPKRLSPIGACGELLIEGPIVGRGYLNDEITTMRSFIEDAHWFQSHGIDGVDRLYRTGDIVRYDWNGSIHYVGRADNQVKVNGQRVELGEVECRLLSCLPPGTSLAVDIVELGNSQKRLLTAFIAIEDGPDVFTMTDTLEISNQARQRLSVLIQQCENKLPELLPAFMIPLVYLPVRAIPLTNTTKTDRKSLRKMAALVTPEHFVYLVAPNEQHRLPATEMEFVLQRIWGTVLNIEYTSIRATHNFIRLGGDSIAAMRLVSLARSEGVDFSVQDVFARPILSELATAASRVTNSTDEVIEPYSLLETGSNLCESRKEVAFLCNIDEELIEDIYPCTPLQEGLMALSSKDPGAYVAQMVFELPQTVDLSRFKRAWVKVANHCSILRTRIVQTAVMKTLQVIIRGDIIWDIEVSDLAEYLAKERDLLTYGAPLNRFALGGRHFAWTTHHASYDGSSMPLVLKAVQEMYDTETIPQAPPFKIFIKHLQAQDQTKSMEFWQNQLDGAPASSFPSAPSQSYPPRPNSSIRHEATLPRQTSDSTLATTIRTAWALLVSKYTDSTDIVFGNVTSGRTALLNGIERIIGPTIATTLFRIQFHHDDLVLDILKHVQDLSLRIMEHEQIGLQSLRGITPEARRACNFGTLLVIQKVSQSLGGMFGIELPAVSRSLGAPASVIAPAYALALECDLMAEYLVFRASYDDRFISRVQLQRMLGQLDYLIGVLYSVPVDLQLCDLELVSPTDKSQLNQINSSVPPTVERCVHDLIKQQCIRQPDKVAICSWDGELTYKMLDLLSTRVGYYLVSRGVKAGSKIPICSEKSLWVIVAMLGILKAGGAFVLLDPSHPTDRLESIVHEIESEIIMFSSANSLRFAKVGRIEGLIIDQDKISSLPMPRALSESMLAGRASTTDPVYVVFTSGSSGTPKGIVIEHRAFATSAYAHAKALNILPSSRVLQFASYSFDVSLMETLTPLILGATICNPSDAQRLENIAEPINKLNATWMFSSPSFSRTLKVEDLPQLEVLVLGGEAIRGDDIAYWADKVHLVNAYGPSECSVVSTANSDMTLSTEVGNIGVSVAGLCWITDAENPNLLVPIGAVGELLIEGPHLARGYLNNPKKMATSFIDNPVWLPRVSRLYRTGDLVRYNDQMNLIYLGRKDMQIKLRGQRVELGDVEHHLRKCVGFQQQVAAEIVNFKDAKDPFLVAFLSLEDDYTEGTETNYLMIQGTESKQRISTLTAGLDVLLQNSLPSFMIPTFYIPLQKMPLTISGKCDRRALRQLAAELSLDQVIAFRIDNTEQPSPISVMEKNLQTLWSALLGVELQSVGLNSSFFHLGGDSISAVRLVAMAKANGILLTVKYIFKHPRLVDMARVASEVSSADSLTLVPPFSLLGDIDHVKNIVEHASRVCAVSISSVEDVFPCTPIQEAVMALSIQEPGTYLSRTIYPLPASIDLERLKTAWQTVYQLYPILRTRIIQGQHPGTTSMQVVIQQQIEWAVSDTVDAYCTTDKCELPGFGKPMTRLAIIARSHFVWTAHHAIYDGWSTPLMLNAVEKVYYGQQVPLPTGFNTFIKYYKNYEAESERYWRDKLSGQGATMFPLLPTPDYKPIPRTSLSYKVCLPDRPQSNITLATFIRAALALLMGQYSDSQDVIFGVVVSGRNAPIPGVDSIVGPTLATLPLRTVFQQDQSVEDLLASIQSQSIDMIPFEQIGLQNIMRLSQDAFTSCAFQCLLVIQTPTPVQSLGLLDPTPFTESIPASFAFTLECDLLERNMINLRPTFDESVISSEQMTRFLQQFEHITGQLIRTAPGMSIQDLEYASPKEISEIWHLNDKLPDTVEDYVHEMIDRTIADQPGAQAICSWDGTQTYDQLGRLSSDLAKELVGSMNICPEDIIPLCFEKSLWTIVAMLGVMKAGGAFLLLDPTNPTSRLNIILHSVQAKIILCSRQHSYKFSESEWTTLTVDQTTLDGLKEKHRNETFISQVQTSNAAIVNFTSGTTGAPKGIIIEHRSFCSAATYHATAQHLHRGSRVMQFTSYAFDPCLVEILTTLIVGGVVCVPSESDRLNRTWQVMQEMQVNWASFCPTVARSVLPAEKMQLDTLLLGGEAISQTDIDLYVKYTNVIVVYGPSECSVVSTVNNKVQDAGDARVIGKGVGTVCWITNPYNTDKLAAFGCVGELCIEGPVLSRGYLNDAHQTKEAFIYNPSWLKKRKTGDRKVYRTGDLVQYTVDGCIKFVGRKDKQVKLRGQRIELSEVEFQLRKFLPDVTDLAVDLVTFKDASSYALAAFVALNPGLNGHVIGQTRLNSMAMDTMTNLSKYLPSYMVPDAYISVPQIPLTSSGKCDRTHLHKIASEISYNQMKASNSGRGPPPTTRAEKIMHRIWSAVLDDDLANLRTNDTYFGVGGNSILVMRLVALAHTEGIQISVADVFKHPQLSKMALLATSSSSERAIDVPKFSLLGTSGAQDILQARILLGASGQIVDMYPCTSLQETFFEKNLEHPGVYLLQQVFLLPPSIDITRFRECWNCTVTSHALLRTRLIKSNGRYLQVVMDCAPEWQEASDLDHYLKGDVDQRVELGDPLSRYCIVSSGLSDYPRYFVWTTHHAMYDFWSTNLVLDEIEQKYLDGPSVTDEVNFNTLVKYMGEQNRDSVRAFWRTHLLDLKAKPLWAIPENHDPVSDTTLSQIISIKVNSNSEARIGTLIQAAWSLVVERITGASDIVWALSLTGRNAFIAGIEKMVGPVATVVLLRVRVDPNQELRGFLQNIQSVSTEMIPFEQTGLDNIRTINEATEEAFQVALPLIILPQQQAFGKNSGVKRTFLATGRRSKVPFHVECALLEEGVNVQIMFDSVVVEKGAVHQMMADFERILKVIAEGSSSSNGMTVGDLL